MQVEIERHLMGRFAGVRQPAWKGVQPFRRYLKNDLMRANTYMRQRIRFDSGRMQFTTPIRHCNSRRTHPSSINNVFATSQPRGYQRPRPLKECMLGPAGNDAATIQNQQIATEAKSLFHILRYKEHRAVILHQRFAKPLFHLPPQMRIKCRKGFVEEQRIRLDGHAARNNHALPLVTGNLAGTTPGQFLNVHPHQLPLHPRLSLPLRQRTQTKANIFGYSHAWN